MSGSIKFISYYILKINNVSGRIYEFLGSFICFIIGILFVFAPFLYAQAVIAILGFYLLLLGFTYIFEWVVDIISIKAKDNFKRRIRISLPKFLLALIPYNSLIKINEYLKVNGDNINLNLVKKNFTPDLEIFIHVTKSGFGMIGHADFYFDGYVYSYGGYDDTSLRFLTMIGDGVLFIIDNKNDYINFCIEHSKKTLFGFGVYLTKKQKSLIKNKIKKMKDDTYYWKIPKKNKEKMYVNHLYEATNAKFYKFKKGKFKTYFTIGNNCVKLVDNIVKMDVLNITGIISPGTYYDYLYKEFHKKHSNVISYNIYNKKIVDNKVK